MVAKSALYVAALAALSMVAAQNASAAVIPIKSDRADLNMLSGEGANGSEWNLPVGRIYGSQDRTALFMFLLPAIPGETVTSASFKANQSIAATSLFGFNVDMYAVRVGATTATTTADFGNGALSAVGTRIQDDFVIPSTPTGYVNTNAAGDYALTSYLTSNYVAGQYLIVRLNADYSTAPTTPPDPYYSFRAFESGDAATLTLTTIPEPASLGLLGLSGLAMLRRRRQA